MLAINVQIPKLMVAILFCADTIAAVFKGSLDPDPALLGTIIANQLASTCDVEVSSFSLSDPNAGGPKI